MTARTDATIDRLFSDLNEPQREAVAHTDGPLLILAGPGSGKTRVITRRAAHLARTVTTTDRILAITFTNKGAREMRERLTVLGVDRGMTICTFHAFCAKMLRRYADRAGVSPSFTIFDRDDRRKLVKESIERCDLGSERWTPASVDARISRLKNQMVTAENAAGMAIDWHARTLARIYTAYQQLLRENGGLDFDDLLLETAALLTRDVALRERLEDQYQYVLVDEYQDTNGAQYAIARMLTRQRANLCATGDPDQSIYGWRGANIENILAFERDYPGAKVVRLEENYRSTKQILAMSDRLIANNVQRKAKALWTNNAEGDPVRVLEFEDGEDEAKSIAREISDRLNEGDRPGDVAVFYRVNSLSRVLEEAFLREGIRYQIARGVEFYGRKEIKDVLAYLRVLLNPADEVALTRIINTPTRGIGSTTVERLVEIARQRGVRVLELVTSGGELVQLGRAAGRVREFGSLMIKLQSYLALPPSMALDQLISQSGLRAMYGAESDLEDSPVDNLDELISAAKEFEDENAGATVSDWLEHTALLSDVDSVEDDEGRVTLMTLHAAKGLEFPAVFIVAAEDGLLPMRRHDDDNVDMEEERRLLFVGMTRAMKRLTLSRARYRLTRGITERTVRSPFLDEMRVSAVQYGDTWRASNGPAKRKPDRGHAPADLAQWDIGTLVRNPEHGLGRVMSLSRGPQRTHASIQFKNGVRRNYVLEFADLVRVEFEDVGDE